MKSGDSAGLLWALVLLTSFLVALFSSLMAKSCSGFDLSGLGAWNCVEHWLSRYQTLVAGILALAGAMWTVRGMRQQILSSEMLYAKSRQAKARALEVLAVDTFHAIIADSERLKKCGIHVLQCGGEDDPRSLQLIKLQCEKLFPLDKLSQLHSMIEFAESDFSVMLADILVKIQTVKRAIKTHRGGATFCIDDSIQIGVLAHALLNYCEFHDSLPSHKFLYAAEDEEVRDVEEEIERYNHEWGTERKFYSNLSVYRL